MRLKYGEAPMSSTSQTNQNTCTGVTNIHEKGYPSPETIRKKCDPRARGAGYVHDPERKSHLYARTYYHDLPYAYAYNALDCVQGTGDQPRPYGLWLWLSASGQTLCHVAMVMGLLISTSINIITTTVSLLRQ